MPPPDPQGRDGCWGLQLSPEEDALSLWLPLILRRPLPAVSSVRPGPCRAGVSRGLGFPSDKMGVWILFTEVSQTHDVLLHGDQRQFRRRPDLHFMSSPEEKPHSPGQGHRSRSQEHWGSLPGNVPPTGLGFLPPKYLLLPLDF